jgi:hypothetical protein
VLAAAYGVDVAELAVKVSEGALYPNLTVAGSVESMSNCQLSSFPAPTDPFVQSPVQPRRSAQA